MKTAVLNLKDERLYRQHIESAAEALRSGKLVVFPTETVYGIGAHRDNKDAIERIYAVKGRPEEKKLTLMVADAGDVGKYTGHCSLTAKKLMDFFWPGPLAIVFPLADGSDLSIRLPDNSAARDLIRTAKVPVVTTSANLSGRPPATNARQALMDLGGKVSVILDGGTTRLCVPSTIVKVDGERVEIIRHGVIPEASIRSCLENGLVKV